VELTAQLPALLAAFMLAAMLVLSIERFAANRKVRDDHRRYQQRMRRNHGEPQRRRGRPHPRPRPIRRDDFWLWSGW
jgi:hypothetical protein